MVDSRDQGSRGYKLAGLGASGALPACLLLLSLLPAWCLRCSIHPGASLTLEVKRDHRFKETDRVEWHTVKSLCFVELGKQRCVGTIGPAGLHKMGV